MSDNANSSNHTPAAIPTEYSGYRFRSRLEARWAIFFDQLGVRWVYEQEGFELPSGRYLPDFLLPALDSFVEIKPVAPSREEQLACLELADVTRRRVVLFFGEPGFWLDEGAAVIGTESGLVWWPGYVGDQSYLPCLCPVCARVGIEYGGRGARVCGRETHSEITDDKGYSANDERIRAAARTANTHRFWDPLVVLPPSGDRTPATWRRPR